MKKFVFVDSLKTLAKAVQDNLGGTSKLLNYDINNKEIALENLRRIK